MSWIFLLGTPSLEKWTKWVNPGNAKLPSVPEQGKPKPTGHT